MNITFDHAPSREELGSLPIMAKLPSLGLLCRVSSRQIVLSKMLISIPLLIIGLGILYGTIITMIYVNFESLDADRLQLFAWMLLSQVGAGVMSLCLWVNERNRPDRYCAVIDLVDRTIKFAHYSTPVVVNDITSIVLREPSRKGENEVFDLFVVLTRPSESVVIPVAASHDREELCEFCEHVSRMAGVAMDRVTVVRTEVVKHARMGRDK